MWISIYSYIESLKFVSSYYDSMFSPAKILQSEEFSHKDFLKCSRSTSQCSSPGLVIYNLKPVSEIAWSNLLVLLLWFWDHSLLECITSEMLLLYIISQFQLLLYVSCTSTVLTMCTASKDSIYHIKHISHITYIHIFHIS